MASEALCGVRFGIDAHALAAAKCPAPHHPAPGGSHMGTRPGRLPGGQQDRQAPAAQILAELLPRKPQRVCPEDLGDSGAWLRDVDLRRTRRSATGPASGACRDNGSQYSSRPSRVLAPAAASAGSQQGRPQYIMPFPRQHMALAAAGVQEAQTPSGTGSAA